MSRGLGIHQRRMLATLARVEPSGAWVHVPYLLGQVWQEHYKADYDRERAEYQAEVDRTTDEWEKTDPVKAGYFRLLTVSLRSMGRRHGSGTWSVRAWRGAGAIEDTNPSRTFALLAKRNLIKRMPWQGGDSWVAITPEGLAEAAQIKNPKF